MTPVISPVRLQIGLHGIGLLAPGLSGWPEAAAILGSNGDAGPDPTLLPAPDMLPPAERRRASRVIKLVMAIGAEAVRHANLEAARLASVFSSSTGDGHNCHALCETLAGPDRDVSPTRFHNSVHNTAAGYWCIAVQAKGPCQVLAAHDAGFAAGLLEAAIQAIAEQRDVLLVVYDTDYPPPLAATRPVPDAAGVALVLRPQPHVGALAQLTLDWQPVTAPENTLSQPRLEALRQGIPAMRALPLLRQLALQQAGSVTLPALPGQSLHVHVSPCRQPQDHPPC